MREHESIPAATIPEEQHVGELIDEIEATYQQVAAKIDEIKEGEKRIDAKLAALTSTCTAADHDAIKADDARWQNETVNHREWDLELGTVLELAECIHCQIGTLARPAK